MSCESDPTTAPLLRQLSPLTALLLKRQNMPEWFEPQSGKFSATRGPAGFQAAMAPLLQTMGMPELAKKFHAQSLKTPSKESWLKYGYYNGALSLFAQGYMDKFYRFNSLGELLPRGKEVKSCG
mgnify:FL=1